MRVHITGKGIACLLRIAFPNMIFLLIFVPRHADENHLRLSKIDHDQNQFSSNFDAHFWSLDVP